MDKELKKKKKQNKQAERYMRQKIMIKSWTDSTWEDFEYWTKNDKKTLKRILIETIIKEYENPNLQEKISAGIGVDVQTNTIELFIKLKIIL